MKQKRKPRIETFIEAAAAAAMAAALGYAVTSLMNGFYYLPLVPGMAAAAIAFTATRTALGKIGSVRNSPEAAEQAFPALSLADFASVGAPVGALPVSGSVECEAPLLLDDALGQPSPDSRIVQMFGPSQPGAGANVASTEQDDSAAMFESLERLRRSLR